MNKKHVVLKLISGILILITLYMGIKQGWAMITGQVDMLSMLNQWGINPTFALIMGILTLGAAILVLFPQTFVLGNTITIIVIICLIVAQLIHKDLRSAMVELPFLIMPIILLYAGHPLMK